MRDDPYYRLVMSQPIPRKLIDDLQLAPIYRHIRRGHIHYRSSPPPGPRPASGTLAACRARHIRTLRKSVKVGMHRPGRCD